MNYGKFALFFMVYNFADRAHMCIKIKIDELGNIHCEDLEGYTKVYAFEEIKEIRPTILELGE